MSICKYIIRCFVVALLLLYIVPAIAQQRFHASMPRKGMIVDSLMHVREFNDTLAVLRQKIFLDSAIVDKLPGNMLTSELFLPVTYYESKVAKSFQLLPSDSLSMVTEKEVSVRNIVDKVLVDLYLRRPDLVLVTYGDIVDAGPIDSDVDKPVRHNIDIVDKMAPIPLEPDRVKFNAVVTRPNFWSYKGDYSLQFMQYCVSGNWYKGGESSYSMMGGIIMEANYNNKQKVRWDNKLELKLGLQNTRSDSVHSIKSNEDLIRLTSKLGLQASKRWYYTVQMVAQTQFMHSYKSNDVTLYADFLAPLNLNLSIGMDYNVDWMNHKLKGAFHLAPLAYNLKYTSKLDLSERIGIDAGKHSLHDFGSQFTADLTWQLATNLSWRTRMYGYTAYDRVELEWENTFVFQVSKWISAQLFVYPRFDDGVMRDDHHGYWQFKEFSSLGFTYSF